ncbi:MAG: hypothetical protein JW720_06275 [Sedimentisphaerales bacterium]|nr:hypothetical protein [Sedimentisphaerales bacterium]
MDIASNEARRTIRALKQIDPELAYLAALTAVGLKPLSRWEKPLADYGLGRLAELGLLADQIRRTVKTGKEVIETVFGVSPACIELYSRRFSERPIDKSAETQRFEGFLFGYPPCCIEQYIRRPYAPNDVSEQNRKILFHWPCTKCLITAALLPEYRRIHTVINAG